MSAPACATQTKAVWFEVPHARKRLLSIDRWVHVGWCTAETRTKTTSRVIHTRCRCRCRCRRCRRHRRRRRHHRVATRYMSRPRSYGAIEFSSPRRRALNIHTVGRIPGTLRMSFPISSPCHPARTRNGWDPAYVIVHVGYMPAG